MLSRSSRLVSAILLTALSGLSLFAAPRLAHAQAPVVPLWPNGAPGSETWTQQEVAFGEEGNLRIRNVVRPTLTVFLPKTGAGSGASLIIAPGGGFNHLAVNKEGTQVAEWLQSHGVAAFVLKYRLAETGPDYGSRRGGAAGARAGGPAAGAPAAGRAAGAGQRAAGTGGGRGSGMSAIQALAAADGLQAIRVVRQRAAQWGLDPNKIGIVGFSAGGYVAVKAALEHDADSRPNFLGAIYTCCVQAPFSVPDDAPPLFVASAYDDGISVTAGPALFIAWKAANKLAEIHIYSAGGHGFGMDKQNLPSDSWIDRFGEWLKFQQLVK